MFSQPWSAKRSSTRRDLRAASRSTCPRRPAGRRSASTTSGTRVSAGEAAQVVRHELRPGRAVEPERRTGPRASATSPAPRPSGPRASCPSARSSPRPSPARGSQARRTSRQMPMSAALIVRVSFCVSSSSTSTPPTTSTCASRRNVVDHLVERDAAGDARSTSSSGPCCRRRSAAAPACCTRRPRSRASARRGLVDLAHAVLQPVLGQHDRPAAERVGRDDVGARPRGSRGARRG